MRRRFPWSVVYVAMFVAGVVVAYVLSTPETQATISTAFAALIERF